MIHKSDQFNGHFHAFYRHWNHNYPYLIEGGVCLVGRLVLVLDSSGITYLTSLRVIVLTTFRRGYSLPDEQ